MSNSSVRAAASAKNDEFYTRYEDIQIELNHYRDQFKDKVVYCNCDDPGESNFSRFFMLNFEYFGLKKLICTHYINSDLFGWLEDRRKGYMLEITGKDKVKKTYLKDNGDFRSYECAMLLEEADIVCTNPPFSLFREYIAQLIQHKKQFLVIGPINAITYKEIFPLIKDNKIWSGYTNPKEFESPDHHIEKLGNVQWWTNLDTIKRHEKLVLYEKYDPFKYPKYDNYNAIEVSKTVEIPCDYYSEMGVPISFLDKYNPEQFEIIDGIGRYSVLHNEKTKKAGKYLSMIGGNAKYFRIVIKRKDI